MRLLVTGGSGLIGSKIVKCLPEHDVYYTFLNNRHDLGRATPLKLDITARKDTVAAIAKIKPDAVIHAAAMANMDLCETDKAAAGKINIEGTASVAEGCKKAGSKLIYISTSAVFNSDGRKIQEEEETNPVNYYGFTKLGGEKLVSEVPHMIIRTDQPYCWPEPWQKKNSVTRVLEQLNKQEIAREVTDWYNTPTFVDNFVLVLKSLMEKGKSGIYHAVGPDFLSRYEMAGKVADIFGADRSLVKAIKSEELNLPARRGKNWLDNRKAEKDSGIRLVGLEEGLNAMKSSVLQ